MSNPTTIPDTFLRPEVPPHAASRKLDFTKSTPPLPCYKDHFAAIIDNVLTPSECSELIHLAEASTIAPSSPAQPPTWERATINIGGGHQMIATDARNCGRIIYDTPDLATRLLSRLQPFLEEYGLTHVENQPLVTGLRGRGKRYQLTRLNERLRFLKYEGGEYFQPHCDGRYVTPDQSEMSFYTLHLYLNGEGEQDVAELEREQERVESGGPEVVNTDVGGKLLGGSTSFMSISGFNARDNQVRVFPRAGSVLVFQQNNLLHGGDSVVRGTKYTLRTDVLYRQV